MAFGPHHSPTEPYLYSLLFASPMCSLGSLPVSPMAFSLKHLIPGRAALCKQEQAHWFLCLFEFDEHRSFLERIPSEGTDGVSDPDEPRPRLAQSVSLWHCLSPSTKLGVTGILPLGHLAHRPWVPSTCLRTVRQP